VVLSILRYLSILRLHPCANINPPIEDFLTTVVFHSSLQWFLIFFTTENLLFHNLIVTVCSSERSLSGFTGIKDDRKGHYVQGEVVSILFVESG